MPLSLENKRKQIGWVKVLYLEESWVYQNRRSEYGWFPNDESELPIYLSGIGARYVILHAACTENMLLPGCDRVFKAQFGEGDYQKEISGAFFVYW